MDSELGSIWVKMGTVLTSDHASVVSINLFVTLLCACIVIGHLLEENRWMNESITALATGLCSGVIILLTSGGKSSRILVFSEDIFFIYLLPPIIFNAGFQVKKKQFFRNFMTIMLFGAVGTLISFVIISLGAMQLFQMLDIAPLSIGDYLALGAIFSATDSVCTLQVLNQDEIPLLYSLVFGEGVVNDATSVVLLNAIQRFDLSHIDSKIAFQFAGNFFYLFVASTLLGVLAGLLSAYTIKRLYFGRHSTDREVALMMLMAYLSYMVAELFHLSAILTVFFCGIVMSHYTWYNVTESSRVTTKHTFATLSSISEIFIFLYVGMDALDIEKWKFVRNRISAEITRKYGKWQCKFLDEELACFMELLLLGMLILLYYLIYDARWNHIITCLGKSVEASSILIGLILVGRAAFVFPLSFLSNLTKKSLNDKLTFQQQITVWWAGLMRGAVSMALAYHQFTRAGHTKLSGHAMMITSTITVVLFSTVVFGLMTKPLIWLLLPPNAKHSNGITSETSSPKSVLSPLLGNREDSVVEVGSNDVAYPSSLCMLLSTPSHNVHYYWRKFDNAFMRPVFGGRGFAPFIPGSPIEQGDYPW